MTVHSYVVHKGDKLWSWCSGTDRHGVKHHEPKPTLHQYGYWPPRRCLICYPEITDDGQERTTKSN